jgi:hypothetical protein
MQDYNGLLGPPTKFTTLSLKTPLREEREQRKPDVRRVVLSSAEGAVALAASWVPVSRSGATHAD